MAASLQKMIFVALVFTIAIPISTSRGLEESETESPPKEESDIESYLRDLCLETNKSKQCWKIIKPELSRFSDTDSRSVAGVVIDLAIEKSSEIHDELNQIYDGSTDDKLKEKYISCSKNYKDANDDLGVAKGNLDSDEYRNIPVQIEDIAEELKSCKGVFGKSSFDPAHIRNRNREFTHYMEIVKVATDRLLKDKERA